MPYYPFSDYSFIKFTKSHKAGKKYNAILRNKKTGGTVKIPFGDLSYEQFKDKTGLGLYTHLDHRDTKRKRAYKIRHDKDVRPNNYSAGYFSMKYLWD
jgi:hypothetical protein